MKFTYFGHSCFAVEVAGKSLLFDPFIRPNPLAEAVDVDAISSDYILISHGHEDHVADALEIAARTGARLISSFEVVSWFVEKGLELVHPMNLGGQASFDFGTVKYVNAIHSSAMPDGKNGGNPGGFVIDSEVGAFYYAGDTALTMDMKLIADEYAIRFAVLPIGDNFTMGAADAARAAEFVDTEVVVGVHYGTFPPIVIDLDAARNTFAKAGKRLLLPAIGESIEL